MSRRNLIFLSLFIAIAALVALFAVGLNRAGGRPGGLVVNSRLGEVSVKEKPATDFSLTTLQGNALTLSDLRGKVVMLDFWSSWCPPCRAEAPELVEAYKRFKDRGVEFLGIAIWDDRRQVENFVRDYGVPYLNALDEKGKIAIDYGVTGIPEKYFIDQNGNLVRKFVGPMKVSDLESILESLLQPQ